MYCYHCAKHIDEEKLEQKGSSFASVTDEVGENVGIAYVCPRCGHLIHAGASEEDVKSLARASHAQIQRARNFLSTGLGFAAVGVILGIISILFYFLACKPSNQYQLVTNCAEFYVFLVLGIIAIILLVAGVFFIVRGIVRKKRNVDLLKDINTQTFVQ